MRHPLIELFHLSNLLQMPNGYRVVNVEFFSNFLCSFKRISFDDSSQLIIVNFWCLATMLLICKALVSSAKLLEPPLHCRFFSSSWATCSVNGTSPYVGTEIPSHWDLVEGGVLQLSGCITVWHSDNTNSVCFVSFQSTFICLLCAYWSYPRQLMEQR